MGPGAGSTIAPGPFPRTSRRTRRRPRRHRPRPGLAGPPRELTGIDQDLAALSTPTLDGFERAFRQGLANGLDPDAGPLVSLSFPAVRGTQICRVDVKPAPKPVFLVGKGAPPEFRVRKANASPALDIKAAYEYIGQHCGWTAR